MRVPVGPYVIGVIVLAGCLPTEDGDRVSIVSSSGVSNRSQDSSGNTMRKQDGAGDRFDEDSAYTSDRSAQVQADAASELSLDYTQRKSTSEPRSGLTFFGRYEAKVLRDRPGVDIGNGWKDLQYPNSVVVFVEVIERQTQEPISGAEVRLETEFPNIHDSSGRPIRDVIVVRTDSDGLAIIPTLTGHRLREAYALGRAIVPGVYGIELKSSLPEADVAVGHLLVRASGRKAVRKTVGLDPEKIDFLALTASSDVDRKVTYHLPPPVALRAGLDSVASRIEVVGSSGGSAGTGPLPTSSASTTKWSYTGQYKVIDRWRNLQPTDQLALEAWVYRNRSGREMHVISKKAADAGGWDLIVYHDDYVRFRIHVQNGAQLALAQAKSTTKITSGSWHHLLATYDGSYLWLYVDGRLEATIRQFGNLPALDREVTLGSESVTHRFKWDGRIEGATVATTFVKEQEAKSRYLAGR